jgi:hypothetical protein
VCSLLISDIYLLTYFRDLQADLFPFLDDMLGPLVVLTARITNSGSEKPHAKTLDPEATGKIFECFSHVLR